MRTAGVTPHLTIAGVVAMQSLEEGWCADIDSSPETAVAASFGGTLSISSISCVHEAAVCEPITRDAAAINGTDFTATLDCHGGWHVHDVGDSYVRQHRPGYSLSRKDMVANVLGAIATNATAATRSHPPTFAHETSRHVQDMHRHFGGSTPGHHSAYIVEEAADTDDDRQWLTVRGKRLFTGRPGFKQVQVWTVTLGEFPVGAARAVLPTGGVFVDTSRAHGATPDHNDVVHEAVHGRSAANATASLPPRHRFVGENILDEMLAQYDDDGLGAGARIEFDTRGHEQVTLVQSRTAVSLVSAIPGRFGVQPTAIQRTPSRTGRRLLADESKVRRLATFLTTHDLQEGATVSTTSPATPPVGHGRRHRLTMRDILARRVLLGAHQRLRFMRTGSKARAALEFKGALTSLQQGMSADLLTEHLDTLDAMKPSVEQSLLKMAAVFANSYTSALEEAFYNDESLGMYFLVRGTFISLLYHMGCASDVWLGAPAPPRVHSSFVHTRLRPRTSTLRNSTYCSK